MWRRWGVMMIAILTLVAVGRTALEANRRQATAFYVSPEGSNENSGSLTAPWRTLEYALDQLVPGDVLYLRGGRYYEHGIRLRLRGSETAPITIQSYPGERAIIDGGIPDFRGVPGAAWEVVDGTIGLYRSRRSFPDGFDFVRGWLVNDDVQLIEYESAENLESTNYGPLNGMAPIYVGPGLQLRPDGHIYIRLAPNPNDLTDPAGNRVAPIPADVNPNNNSISIFFSDALFVLDGAGYLHFKDLEFSHAEYIMDARDHSRHITLSGCRLNYGNYGLVLRENAREWEIYDCEFSNGTPEYVYWTDVKNRGRDVTEAYPEFQSAAISGSMSGFFIHHNLFRDTFDGVTVKEGTEQARIVGNVFREVRDDSINLSRGIRDVEVAHNMLWHVKSGISNLGSDAAPGHVYIHHNVIDNSAFQRGGRPGNYREDNWPVWTIGTPFPDHDDGNKASWWKLYNNTVVSRQNVGHEWAAAGPDSVAGNEEKYVYNNIFYIFDERVIFRDDLITSGSHYDGNVVYQAAVETLPLFSDFGDGGRYYSLLDFQMNSGTEWEAHGLEIDPGFDLLAITSPVFESAMMWERYRPSSIQVFTTGASYKGLDWPGTAGVDYRGAIPPR